MHNNVFLIGRLTAEPVKQEVNGKTYVSVTLAVQRSYKNEEGVYETDFIPVNLWNAIAENVLEYCKKGDLVGVKGRLEFNTYNDGKVVIIADKVTFLASKNYNE